MTIRKQCYRNRAMRMALGLKQEEVADLIGISIGMVSMYERDLVDGEAYDAPIANALNEVKARMVQKMGYWYNAYIDNKAALHEIEVHLELDGNVPAEVISHAKTCAIVFSGV